jgi:hypothetical protein
MYQDDGAVAYRTKQEMYDFLKDHLFPRLAWQDVLGLPKKFQIINISKRAA